MFFDALEELEELEKAVMSPDDPVAQLPVKAAYCPLCKGWMMVSTMPHAEIDKDTIKQFSHAALEGYDIKIIPNIEFQASLHCDCGGPPDVPLPKREYNKNPKCSRWKQKS